MKSDKLKHITLRIGRDMYTGKNVEFEFKGYISKVGTAQLKGEPEYKQYEILLSGEINRLEYD